MAVIVKNTFIEVSASVELVGAQRRTNSAPPGSTPCSQFAEAQVDFKSLDIHTSVNAAHEGRCVGTAGLSPRSDRSTEASSDDARPPAHDSRTRATYAQPASADVEPRADGGIDSQIHGTSGFEIRDFHLCINKADNPQLGIDVKRVDGITLLVQSVSASGLVGKWNQEHPSLQVRPGDYIVTVNGISGSAMEMLRECKRCPVLNIRIISNLSPELLGTLVSTLRGSQVRQTPVASQAKPQKTHSMSMANRESDGYDGTEPGQVKTSETFNLENSPGVADKQASSELSLVNLLQKAEVTSGHVESDAVASRTPNQSSNRTKLKSSAPAFTPVFGGLGGEVVVAKAGSCAEVGVLLKSMAQSLSFNPDVQSVQVVENELGASYAVHIELPPLQSTRSAAVQVVRALAKSAMLDAAKQSQNTYVIGYLDEPFSNVGDYSFKAAMASMPDSEAACWDFFQKGRCANQGICRRRHPSVDDMVTVWVHLQHNLGFHAGTQ